MADKEGKYLTFSLADEEYGIGILKIKEIIGMMPITTVPQTPEFVKGVINLRGKVIPVIDLRLRFGMDAIDYTERTCIIVVEFVILLFSAVAVYQMFSMSNLGVLQDEGAGRAADARSGYLYCYGRCRHKS
ncbi:MAG: purine-binding chemotaxis protein CheW [Bacteroidetes bacterium]|nr:purine-binding chemotaxis protein CheW [Bacteroidota bacterium]